MTELKLGGDPQAWILALQLGLGVFEGLTVLSEYRCSLDLRAKDERVRDLATATT